MSPDTPGSKLDVNAVFNRTIEIYKSTAVLVWSVAIMLLLPAYVIYGLLLNVNRLAGFIGYILVIIASAWLAGSIVRLVQSAEVSGSVGISPGELLKSVTDKLTPIIVVELIIGIVVGILAGLLITLPIALYLALMWIVALPALVVEDQGISGALGRSNQLTKDNRWRILWLGVLLTLIIAGISVIVMILAAQSLALGILIGAILAILLYPFLAIIRSVLYFELLKIKGQSSSALDSSVNN